MKNQLCAFKKLVEDDFYDRTERIDGPEVQEFTPTLQELIQLVKFHINEFIEMRWYAFTNGWEISEAVDDAIWSRLDKIRRVLREDDFKHTIELACIQFGLEVDVTIWEA